MLRERREKLIGIKQEQRIPVSGLVVSEMVMESKFGQMVPAMREIGKTTEHKASENSPILTVTSTRATG